MLKTGSIRKGCIHKHNPATRDHRQGAKQDNKQDICSKQTHDFFISYSLFIQLKVVTYTFCIQNVYK
jgi:hypothetical protein